LTALTCRILPYFAFPVTESHFIHNFFCPANCGKTGQKPAFHTESVPLGRRLIAFDEDTFCVPWQGTNQPCFAPFHYENPRYDLIFTTDLLPNIEPQYDKQMAEPGIRLALPSDILPVL